MFIISFVAGWLSTMNMWVNSISDVRLHVNDLYMVILMTGWMLLFMIVFDKKNYKNMLLLVVIIGVICITIYLIRTQTFVDDIQFMRGMIPHHSMAITMASHIQTKTKNPIIKKLTKNIIESQQKEIDVMNMLLENI